MLDITTFTEHALGSPSKWKEKRKYTTWKESVKSVLFMVNGYDCTKIQRYLRKFLNLFLM